MRSSRAPRRGDAPTIEGCLAEVRAGRPAPVYLIDGDPFLTLRAAREMAFALVPEAQRSLNLVELDAAASPAEVAAELSTGGLFGGGKVVLLAEPAFLQSKEDAGEAFERARVMWGEGRQREAARRLLALAAKAGWAAEDLDPGDDGARSETAWKRELGIELDAAGLAFLAEAARYARERNLKAAKDDASALDALLSTGLPPGHALLVAAGKVDGRLPLAKKLAAAGRRVTVAVEREGQWDAQRLVLGPVLSALLAGTGKSVDGGAEERLAERVGDDARVLAAEVAKLAAYVGDRKVIRAEDVEEVVVRVAADPFFALGNAVEARDLAEALAVLERSLADGLSPHMLLGSLAGTVRRLLAERERARMAAGPRRIGSYSEWSSRILPSIAEEELGQRKPYGFWMKYQASMRFSREELLDALASLAEADHAMKTGGDGRLALESILMRLLAARGSERSIG
jgi:DNA polymerase-3 subunit delta